MIAGDIVEIVNGCNQYFENGDIAKLHHIDEDGWWATLLTGARANDVLFIGAEGEDFVCGDILNNPCNPQPIMYNG